MKAATALVEKIAVADRHRQDLGDIGPLVESIDTLGLLHPIVVTSDLRLIAGQRRLESVKKLGWREVDVRIADDLDAATELLVAERDENTCRKDMTASELYALGAALTELERPAASERQRVAGISNLPGSELVSDETNSSTGRTSEVVAPAVGMSHANWKRLKSIGDRAADGDQEAADMLEQIDRGEASISGAYRDLCAKDEPQPARAYAASVQRADEIRELAEAGNNAQQIATALGIGRPQVMKIAHKHGVTLVETRIGKRRRPDATRIVRETVTAAEGAVFGLDLIVYDELDRSQLEEWTSSLSNSIRALNRLNKQLKEMIHD